VSYRLMEPRLRVVAWIGRASLQSAVFQEKNLSDANRMAWLSFMVGQLADTLTRRFLCLGERLSDRVLAIAATGRDFPDNLRGSGAAG
jgi:hypothetical protein